LSPVLGTNDGRAVALLYNGILGEKSVSGGNVLTRGTLAIIRAALPDGFLGPLTVYGERSALSQVTLEKFGITFKQTPYDVKARA
jgi:adenine-specific DNA-methyltransferase